MRPAGRRIAIVLIAALAAVTSVRRFLPDLASRFRFEDDASQHVWWTYRFADPALFPGDLAAEYFSGTTFAPLGYQALARVFVPFVDAQTFSEIVPFGLTAIVAVLAVLIGLAVSNGSWLGAGVAASFALLGGVLARVEGGLPRAWAMPVLLFGLWAMLARRWATFGAAMVAAAVFYPPLIVSLGLAGGAALAIDLVRTRRLPRNWIPAAALGCVAVAIVAAAYRTPKPDPMGPKVTAAVAREMPEFGPEGRSRFFSPDAFEFYVTNARSGLGVDVGHLFGWGAAIALGLWLLPRAVPPAVWAIPATALVAYVAAHATLFALHLPSRYTRFVLPAFLTVWAAAIVPAAIARLRAWPPAARMLERVGRPGVLAALLGLALAGVATEAAVHVRRKMAPPPPPGYPEVMAFLSGLPADTLIAAHPTDASTIPLLARRSVLACQETSTPYDLGYYARMKERISAELAAFYASDWSAVDRLADQYGVDVFVADRSRYKKPVAWARTYFEPFRSAMRGLVEEGGRRGFVLEDPPPERVLFHFGNYTAVQVKRAR